MVVRPCSLEDQLLHSLRVIAVIATGMDLHRAMVWVALAETGARRFFDEQNHQLPLQPLALSSKRMVG